MKTLRPWLLAFAFVAGFYYFTTHRSTFDAAVGAVRTPHLDITEAAQTATGAGATMDPDEQTNIAVYKRVLPAVVNITSTTLNWDFFYGAVPAQGAGSGFIIDKDGYILTNYHVIANARQIEVTLSNQKKYRAQVIGASREHDLAVIRIQAPELTPAVLGDSRGLVVGQKVYAIGNPFGLSGTMTRGIVSSIRAVQASRDVYIDEAIQTDAAINPGNSGGPLLNSRGEVVGINTLILSEVGQSAGIGFAIPINAAKAILNDLVTIGTVRRPALGVVTAPITPELAQQMGLGADYGLLIVRLVRGGAADTAGLKAGTQRALLGNMPITLGGDLIVAIDGGEIRDHQDLAQTMNRHRAGDRVMVTVLRGRNRLNLPVVLGEAGEQARGMGV